MIKSVRIPGIGRIRKSTEKLSGRVPEKVESLGVLENIESLRVSGIGRIRESTKKLTGRVRENGRIYASTGK